MNSRKLILYPSVFAIQGLCNSVIPILPELTASGGAEYSPGASSLLFSGYFLGAFLTMLPFGILADRVGNLRLVGLGVAITALAGSIISFSDNLWMLGTFRFVEGMGCGAFFPAAFSMLSEEKNSQRSLGEFTFLLNAGLAAGVYFSGLFAGQEIKTAVWIFTLFAWLAAFTYLLLPGKLVSGTKTGSRTETSGSAVMAPEKGRREGREKGRREEKETKPFPLRTSSSGKLAMYLKRTTGTLFESRFGKLWGISVLLYGTTGLLTANYPEYSAGFLTKPELGLAISASYVAAMLGSLAAGRANTEYRTVIRTGLGLAAAGILLSSGSPVLAFSLIGAGGGAAVVGLITAVSKLNTSGFAMGLFNTGIYAGFGLVPLLGSAFLGILGFEGLFSVCAFVLLAALLIKY